VRPEAVEACEVSREPAFEVFRCPRVRLDMRHEGPDELREVPVLHGLRLPVVDGTVWVPVERQPEPREFVLKLGQAVTEHDVRPRGLHQRRPVLGVHAALPCHALGVALKLRGRLDLVRY